MRISYVVPALALLLSSSCTHSTKIQYSDIEAQEAQMRIPYVPERTPSAEDVDWFAAADKQVQNATCRATLPKTSADIAKYYRSSFKGHLNDGGTYEVFGLQFENERPELILAFSKLFVPDQYRAPEESERAPKNLNDKFRIDAKCKSVLCASQTIFGKEVGPQMVFLMEKFDINTSPYTYGNASTFRADEITDIIKALELVDTSILPFQRNQKLTKFSRGYTLKMYGPGVLANASMEFFDGWSKEKSATRQYAAFHEFAHNFANSRMQSYDTAQAWLKLSGWEEKPDAERTFEIAKSESKKPHRFVSKYGKSNPFEDFAESVSAYRLNPSLLKKKSQAKYDFIKYYVFDGLEYDSAKGCQKEPAIKTYQAQIDKDVHPFTDLEKAAIRKSCSLDFYALAFANGYQSTFKACVDFEAANIWTKKISEKNKEVVPKSIFDGDYGLSNLKFNSLSLEISKDLTGESTDWLMSKLKSNAYLFRSDMNVDRYCEVWGKVKTSSFPVSYEESKWRRNYYLPIRTSYTTRPNEGKLIEMCKQISGAHAPSSQSSSTTIHSFIKTVSMVATRDVLSERNLSRENVFDVISSKTMPRK